MRRIPLTTACLVDLLVGDPPALPHPVQGLGRAIELCEAALRARLKPGDARAEFLAGAALTLGLTTAAWLAARFASSRSVWVETILGAAALATRSLDDAIGCVDAALKRGSIESAREQLARIVGRDTVDLDENEIARATLETAAESLCDGIVAPLLALRVAGVSGTWALKAINTLDSMIGHVEPPYTYFGRVAARADDVANFIPARLTVISLVVAAMIAAEDPRGALATAWRDHGGHRSPNAGWCEAALAGALHVRLGGENRYDGKFLSGAVFGKEYRAAQAADIPRGRRIIRIASAVAIVATLASATS